MKKTKTHVIKWNDWHWTLVVLDTRSRRNRWIRRAVRCSKRGDLDGAYANLIGVKGNPVHDGEVEDREFTHEEVMDRENW